MKSFGTISLLFEKYLNGLGYKKSTIDYNIYSVNRFFNYLRSKNFSDIKDIYKEEIIDYVGCLMSENSRFKKPFSKSTIDKTVSILKHLFNFLYRSDILLLNPMEDLELKIRGLEKQREIFGYEEISKFLDSIDIESVHGERNQALFELMYSSGLRISEVEKLNLGDVDLSERVLAVRSGKGDKDRFVPFSDVACQFLKKYIKSERKHVIKFVTLAEDKALFLSYHGRLKVSAIRQQFKKILKLAGINRKGLTLHSIRHTTATHLLEAGADVRYVAELLGHDNIQTTVRYTHLMIEHLKKVYKSFHPRENKHYEEVDEEYLDNIEKMKQEILRRRQINKRYS